MSPSAVTRRIPIVVLISGNGGNLQAIIDQAARGLPVDIRAVISNRPGAYGLERARNAGIPARVVDHSQYRNREEFEQDLTDVIDEYAPELVVMAGFMRILGPAFIARYRGRMLNIHPSLLPSYRGLDTHRRVLEAGDTTHGVSVHFVTDELDGGPVICQTEVPVLPGDTPESLAARVREAEHRLYPAVLRGFAEGRVRMADNQVTLDGRKLTGPVSYTDFTGETPVNA